MRKTFSHNPHKDRDRRAIWNMLMPEDFEDWCSGSFAKCKKLFDRDFCGYLPYDGVSGTRPRFGT